MFARVVASVLFASALVQASNVIDLTPANFDAMVGRGKPVLVEFFAPWCGHCKKLAPIYEELADAFSHSSDVVIAKVDADAEKELGTKYDVKGFPTIKWFNKDGSPEDYEGGRELIDLATYVTQKSGVKSKINPPPPPSFKQLDYTNLEKTIMDPTKHVLVAFTASWCGHCKAMKPTYDTVAKNFKLEKDVVIANFECDAEPNKLLAQKHDVSSFPTLKFFPKGSDKTPILYEGGRTEKDFVEYLNGKCGTHRAVGGGLNDEAGRIAHLDELAQEFFNVDPQSRKLIYLKAVRAAESSHENAKHYIRAMEKVLNGTNTYIEKETTRLANILKKQALSEDKVDEIKIKANILSTFTTKIEDTAQVVESGAKAAREEL